MRSTHLTAHITTKLELIHTYVLYQNRLIKIPTGLRLKQPKVHLCHELITVPSGLNLQVLKVQVWDYTKSPEMNFNMDFVPAKTPISSTSMQELNICTHCWQPVTGNLLMHKNCETLCLQAIIGLIG